MSAQICRICLAYQYSRTNKVHFLFSVYYELIASTCFEPTDYELGGLGIESQSG
jgi:hypothetical protein